jgi:hypothetical protein
MVQVMPDLIFTVPVNSSGIHNRSIVFTRYEHILPPAARGPHGMGDLLKFASFFMSFSNAVRNAG